jgi:hypothetical protein
MATFEHGASPWDSAAEQAAGADGAPSLANSARRPAAQPHGVGQMNPGAS